MDLAFLDRPSRRAHTLANQDGAGNAFQSVDQIPPLTGSHWVVGFPRCPSDARASSIWGVIDC